MTIVGFSFTKMHVEKLGAPRGKVSIESNVTVTGVDKFDMSVGTSKQDGVKFTFEYLTMYEPNVAEIKLAGEVFYMNSVEKVKEVLDQWRKKKTVSKDVLVDVMNACLTKCNIQAIVLSDDLNLPPPIEMPRVRVTNAEGQEQQKVQEVKDSKPEAKESKTAKK